jgi:ABC-2 type transport system ATP-binding protein
VIQVSVIKVEHLTKDYGNNKGVFDVTFEIDKGEVFGFLGPNGSGKTVTIRHLLGFTRPQSGQTSIGGLDCWKSPKEIQRKIGYLPGEMNFPGDMTGTQLIKFLADMRGLSDMFKMKKLTERFKLDTSGDLKRMSKGMKQKMGIICAFMHDPEILVLDEPTIGLDPLMRATFLELIREEKQNGRSILMSSHMFDEIENSCDRVGIIKHGRIVATIDPKDIKHAERKTFKIEFLNRDDFNSMRNESFKIRESRPENNQIILDVDDARSGELFAALNKRKVKFISEIKHDLEEYFMGYYKGDEDNDQ